MSWRVAKSLDKLLEQLNAAAPKRSKISDGAIGDAAHATRDSDHNPWVKDGAMGVVTARDFTHDPANGADMNKFTEAIRLSKDSRVKYVLWNRQMYSSYAASGYAPFMWRPYSGSNPHTRHSHVSVQPQKNLYDSEKAWVITPKQPKKWHLKATRDRAERTAVFGQWTKAREWIRTKAKNGWRVVARKR